MPDRHAGNVGPSGRVSGSFPPAFPIGPNSLTNPLVSIKYVKAHLSLLGAFKTLGKRVETCPLEDLPVLARCLDYTPQTPRRWAWFVCLAVERFRRWTKHVTANQDVDSWVKAEAPPLDVLMVWHAYMLNPTWYAEDCLRIPRLHSLQLLDDRLLPAVIAMGDPAQYQPSEERKRAWVANTGTLFDPIEALKHLSHHDVICPRCHKRNTAPFLTAEGDGYAQQGFTLPCSQCSLPIDKSDLALDKLARDLVKDHNSPDTKLDTYFPGTLRGPTDMASTEHAKQIKDRVVQFKYFVRPKGSTTEKEWVRQINEDFGYSIEDVHQTLRSWSSKIGLLTRILNRILSAYTDDSPFSIDLVGAVIRQGSFTDKMHVFGWTSPGYFDKPIDEVVLVHAITRYHAFLDMMTSSPASFFVPTLDIDLIWHTHQLMAGKYADDCMKYVGRYIDHDDKVEETVSQTHLISPAGPGSNDSASHTAIVAARSLETPSARSSVGFWLTVGAAVTCVLRHTRRPVATHASEHNAVQVHLNAALNKKTAAALERQRKRRERKMRSRRQRDARFVRSGELDPEQYRRGQAHYAAFLMPVPFNSQPIASCVSVNQSQCAAVSPDVLHGEGVCSQQNLMYMHRAPEIVLPERAPVEGAAVEEVVVEEAAVEEAAVVAGEGARAVAVEEEARAAVVEVEEAQAVAAVLSSESGTT
ncbi:uncharacterized protein B0H18DRAFT_905631 [Fomitopsis serialis]|uniref:uncharacterized protein n=1 Tax=Fomitopsis serialis TaxID=139415 RepID=UPI002007284C|nr:uncharacterized protein B0H18DRAFT_905631 [Neoantrodia serialis]KAH9930344.1 hypothetical protein B0H18DRAFT_905631 [Neoantrodia serialis]